MGYDAARLALLGRINDKDTMEQVGCMDGCEASHWHAAAQTVSAPCNRAPRFPTVPFLAVPQTPAGQQLAAYCVRV